MGDPWSTHGLVYKPVDAAWENPGPARYKPMSDPWASHGRPIVDPWASIINPWATHSLPMDQYYEPTGDP